MGEPAFDGGEIEWVSAQELEQGALGFYHLGCGRGSLIAQPFRDGYQPVRIPMEERPILDREAAHLHLGPHVADDAVPVRRDLPSREDLETGRAAPDASEIAAPTVGDDPDRASR